MSGETFVREFLLAILATQIGDEAMQVVWALDDERREALDRVEQLEAALREMASDTILDRQKLARRCT